MENIQNILQLIATAIAIVGLFLVWYRLRLLHQQAVFQSLSHFQAIVLKPELQEALRFIYSCEPHQLSDPTCVVQLAKVELILNHYDLLAWRIKKGIIPLKDVIEIEWPVLLRFWQQLREFVEAEQKRRGDVPYKESLKWLVGKASEYKQTHYPDITVKIHKRGSNANEKRK